MHMFLRLSARRPFFLTVLREPISRLVSAFNYPPWLHVARGPAASKSANWSAILAEYEKGGVFSPRGSVFRNSMALDLGWYSRTGSTLGVFRDDHNETQLKTWLHGLDKKLDLVVLTERFDEGLVLLAHVLGLPVMEFSYRVQNSNAQKKFRPPFPESLRWRLLRMNWPDHVLHSHFERRFSSEWNATDSDVRRDGLATLQAANAAGHIPAYTMQHVHTSGRC